MLFGISSDVRSLTGTTDVLRGFLWLAAIAELAWLADHPFLAALALIASGDSPSRSRRCPSTHGRPMPTKVREYAPVAAFLGVRVQGRWPGGRRSGGPDRLRRGCATALSDDPGGAGCPLRSSLGSVLALAQTEMKRLLAYSSIAHVGYALMGLDLPGRPEGASATMTYAFLLRVHDPGHVRRGHRASARSRRDGGRVSRGLAAQRPGLELRP